VFSCCNMFSYHHPSSTPGLTARRQRWDLLIPNRIDLQKATAVVTEIIVARRLSSPEVGLTSHLGDQRCLSSGTSRGTGPFVEADSGISSWQAQAH